jgi:hypothetical protein
MKRLYIVLCGSPGNRTLAVTLLVMKTQKKKGMCQRHPIVSHVTLLSRMDAPCRSRSSLLVGAVQGHRILSLHHVNELGRRLV